MSTILVVDDEPTILETIRIYFGEDHEVHTAKNATEGLQEFLKHFPAVVVTDIRMPGMDGIEFAKRLIEIYMKVKIIILTGHGDTYDALDAFKIGVVDFLRKPVDVEELRQAIERALGQIEKETARPQKDQQGKIV